MNQETSTGCPVETGEEMQPGCMLASWSVHKKLLLLLLIVFLPAFAIITVTGLRERADAIEKARNKAVLIAESLAAQQEEIGAAARQILSTLALLPEVQRVDPDACNNLFRALIKQNPVFEAMMATTPDGRVFASSEPFESGGVNLSDRKHFTDAMETRDFAVGEYENRITKNPAIIYSYPVIDDRSGNIVAVAATSLCLKKFSDFVAKAGMPEGYSVVFADCNGVRLYRWPENAATPIGRPIPENRFHVLAGASESGTFETLAEDGVSRVSAYKQIRLRKDFPPYMFIVVGMPEGKTVERATGRMLLNMVLLIGASLTAVFLAWILGGMLFVKPMDKLAAAAARFGEGKFDARAGLGRREDELGRLARSFDQMAAMLETRDTERNTAEEALANAYLQLEERIRERTAELTDANTNLMVEIRERQAAKTSLGEAYKRLDALIEFFPDATFVIDANGKVTHWNRAIEKMTGVLKADMLQKEDYEYALPFYGKRRPILADVALVMTSDPEFETKDYDLVPREGDWISGEVFAPGLFEDKGAYLSVTASVLRDSMGAVTGAIESIRDVTERKRVEDALRESKLAYDEMVAQVPVGIYKITIKPQGDMAFDYVSPRFCQIMGIKCEDALRDPKVVFDLIHPEDLQNFAEIKEAAKKMEGPFQWESRFVLNGEVRFIRFESAPRKSKDGDIIRTGTLQDITNEKCAEAERKELESRLQQAKKTESLGRMAGAIAHNFNNMLGIVIGNLELAMTDAVQGSPMKAWIEEAMKASGRAAEISRFMLTYLGQTLARKEPLDLTEIVGETLALLGPSIPPNVHLIKKLPSGGPIIHGDRAHIGQILTNLVLNALEAIGKANGCLTIALDEAAAEKIGKFDFLPTDWKPKEKNYACLSIADTGPGFETAIIERIFDPFFSTRFTGRGMGLPVVLGLARTHEGTVSVAGKPGEGAVFRVYLPILELS